MTTSHRHGETTLKDSPVSVAPWLFLLLNYLFGFFPERIQLDRLELADRLAELPGAAFDVAKTLRRKRRMVSRSALSLSTLYQRARPAAANNRSPTSWLRCSGSGGAMRCLGFFHDLGPHRVGFGPIKTNPGRPVLNFLGLGQRGKVARNPIQQSLDLLDPIIFAFGCFQFFPVLRAHPSRLPPVHPQIHAGAGGPASGKCPG